jgi:hypothetical protein
VGLNEEIEKIAEVARAYAAEGEGLAAVIPAEPGIGTRVFLCAFTSGSDRSWLALDSGAQPVSDRALLRDAVSIAALCELAEESAGGGSLDELRARLEELASVEGAALAGDAEAALTRLEAVLEASPRIASPAYLDGIGAATRNLEQALGEVAASPFAEAMKQGSVAVEGLSAEVEGSYKLPLA